ncbi:MAG: hypothetical protein LBL47_00550 [Lactobacillus sp.]|jgi:hypothetical protein|nr:hypothetical protein [Lactobacillus sp.]
MSMLIKKIAKETFLLSALDRVAKNPFGYGVLYVSISKLKPKNRHPEFVKIFTKLFDSVVGATKGSLYVLSNGDFVILAKDIAPNMVDEAVKKLREGLARDPILEGEDVTKFAAVYHFPDRFNEFYSYVERIKNSEIRNVSVGANAPRAITASEIEDVINELNSFDIAEIIKRQSVMRYTPPEKFSLMFQEFFVAVKDLTLQFNEKIDLTANKWLFMYMSQRLDKKTMASFVEADLTKWPAKVALNLNLSSIFTKEFDAFINEFPKDNCKIVVEVKVMDVFNNNKQYIEARELLHANGHSFLLDEISPAALKMLDINKIKPDMVKMFWEPLLEFEEESDNDLKAEIEKFGKENVILAKCDSEKAIKWGVSHGITAFQGPFIDDIETAIRKGKCPDSPNCSTLQCLKRRRLITGNKRDECTRKEILDEIW